MNRVWAIAGITFKEAKRDRILYLLFFFAAGTILASRVLAILTVGDRVKIIKDVGLASIQIFGVLMAVLIGTSLVYKEIDKKTVFTLLAKPLRRAEFIMGKFLGLVLTLLVMTAGMSLVFLAVVYLHTFRIEWPMLVAIAYIFLELVLVTAVAILFSSFSTPILSSIFSLAFYLIGHLSWALETLIRKMQAGAGRTAAQVFYTFLPDLENFNFKTEVVHGLPIPAGIFLSSFLYGIFYTAFILVLAVLVFRRRDFI
jgi:ABC-type transport system involved in multi-copper enzyme maturation permease subunit